VGGRRGMDWARGVGRSGGEPRGGMCSRSGSGLISQGVLKWEELTLCWSRLVASKPAMFGYHAAYPPENGSECSTTLKAML
jgi:hypothetical protein